MKSIFARANESPALVNFSKTPELSLFLTTTFNHCQVHTKYNISLPYLFELDSNSEIVNLTDLTTKIFEPFFEDFPNKQRYGFTLNSQEFFCDSEEDLQSFYKLIKKTCILTSIENEFVFIKQIGEGSTCRVFLAQNLKKTKKFAVKCIKKSFLVANSYLQSLLTEIKVLREVKSKNICKLLYVFEDSKKVYLVFDYISECSLYTVIAKKGKIDEGKCKVLVKNLLLTLESIHQQNIVHRDIKLENILINNEENLQFTLIDFGLAFNSCEVQSRKCGSPGYMAPEILRDEKYGEKVDVFSLGVLAYVLLHGYLPFDGNTTSSILANNLKCKISFGQKISSAAQELLKNMLHSNPKQRPTVTELLGYSWFHTKKEVISSLCSTISVV